MIHRQAIAWVLVVWLLAALPAGCGPSETERAAGRYEVEERQVSWEHGGVTFQGFKYVPKDAPAAKLGVVVYPEWWGVNAFARDEARKLAEQAGVVVLAADLYGDGQTTTEVPQAQQWAGALYGDVAEWRGRARAAIEALKAEAGVESFMVMGYCFGGSTALHMGYASPGVRGAVSFHGSLPVPLPDDPIDAKILVLHGEADPLVPREQITEFVDAMNHRTADWTMIAYGHAVHSFTNPAADEVGIDGVAYQAEAARRSWQHMLAMLDELRRAEAR
ncbi:MAG: dienelactone hydrolase family protein [Phycisphaeraceae bacterium]|nr:dienelactone hydrolase family protein [Phycisphaeraceae bacterium]